MTIRIDHKDLKGKVIRLWTRSYVVGDLDKKGKYVTLKPKDGRDPFQTNWPIQCWHPEENFEIIKSNKNE